MTIHLKRALYLFVVLAVLAWVCFLSINPVSAATASPKEGKSLRVTYAEGGSSGMVVGFNDGSVWWFPQCKSEDSRNCSWNASRAGNRVGKSFVDLRGKVYYIPKRFASQL